MTQAAIIKELRSIEAEASVHAEGLKKLQRRSYLLRSELEGVSPSSAPRQSGKNLEAVQASTALRFQKKIAKKIKK
jgi:hypothetical protein